MIAAPLNDRECLTKLTAVAAQGSSSAEMRAVAARFASTKALARWIRTLPQRDDDGSDDDGPRVMCDVGQRARLVADDPNCVERAILYLAAAEVIDPRPKRQLATVDITESLRHTFPVEDGEPVVLDPRVRRNALRAGVWRARNGDSGDDLRSAAVDAEPLVAWLFDLAEAVAEEMPDPDHSLSRVQRARVVAAQLFVGATVCPADRAHVLYALRLAAEAAADFGDAGREGYQIARLVIARALARQTQRRSSRRNLTLERAIYWGGKTVATIYGVGGLYDAAYDEVNQQRTRPPPAHPAAANTEPERPQPLDKAAPGMAAASPTPRGTNAPPAMVLGALAELDKKGSRST